MKLANVEMLSHNLLAEQFQLLRIKENLEERFSQVNPLSKSDFVLDNAKKAIAFSKASSSLTKSNLINRFQTNKQLAEYSIQELVSLNYLSKIESSIKSSNFLFCSFCYISFGVKSLFHEHLDLVHFDKLHYFQKYHPMDLQNALNNL